MEEQQGQETKVWKTGERFGVLYAPRKGKPQKVAEDQGMKASEGMPLKPGACRLLDRF